MCCTCVQLGYHITTQKMCDLTCTECNISYTSATSLLKHFAQHANTEDTITNRNTEVPELYSITNYKTKSMDDSNDNIKIEDDCSQFCAIDILDEASTDDKLKHCSPVRKYKCSYCLKAFGWSTDLKRHILTHTGERPFKCNECDSTFTRKFLLQKHHAKVHQMDGVSDSSGPDGDMPSLRPLKFFKQKSRKQDKEKIKRKLFNAKNACQTVSELKISDNLLCSS